VSTLTEIEAAIEKLPPSQVDQLTAWLQKWRSGKGTAPDNLASLAGSWEEDPAFDSAVKAVEQVDEAMWR
jgi:hypothetical protein